jgi:hypothetical protein
VEAAKAVIEFGFCGSALKSYGVRMQRGTCRANACSKSSVCALLEKIRAGLKRMAGPFGNSSML